LNCDPQNNSLFAIGETLVQLEFQQFLEVLGEFLGVKMSNYLSNEEKKTFDGFNPYQKLVYSLRNGTAGNQPPFILRKRIARIDLIPLQS
jgi:hypothetical protein